MDQKKIGQFLAAMRKAQGMTQEQLAEKLGINHRSISRWENGRCMPDYTVLPSLAAALQVSIPEILDGRKQEDDSQSSEQQKLLTLSRYFEKESNRQKRDISYYFTSGLLFFILSALVYSHHILSAGVFFVGIALHLIGFYKMKQPKAFTLEQLLFLSTGGRNQKLDTAWKMLQFASQNQKTELKQYLKAFEVIEGTLEAGEYALFSLVSEEYTIDSTPLFWHVGIAVTNRRLIIAGERGAGKIYVSYKSDAYPLQAITSIKKAHNKIIFTVGTKQLTIQGSAQEFTDTLLQELRSHI